MSEFKVIDFHTHPYIEEKERIGMYIDEFAMSTEDFFSDAKEANVFKACGSVIGKNVKGFDDIQRFNRHALKLRDMYCDVYVPGFHVHPEYVEKSIAEIEFGIVNGVRLIGELVPYSHKWGNNGYSSAGFMEILDFINGKNMIVNLHIGSPEELIELEKPISFYKNITFVLAHPGYGERFEKHLEINKKYENTYLELSGSGIEVFGAIRKIVNNVGYERLLFGTDYPVTAFKTYISAVLSEKISEEAKEHILFENARELLGVLE